MPAPETNNRPRSIAPYNGRRFIEQPTRSSSLTSKPGADRFASHVFYSITKDQRSECIKFSTTTCTQSLYRVIICHKRLLRLLRKKEQENEQQRKKKKRDDILSNFSRKCLQNCVSRRNFPFL